MLEDSPEDAKLEVATLEEAGFSCDFERVETRDEFIAHLDNSRYDLIIADYCLQSFDGISALKIALERDRDTPFILVSGALGEEAAIESLKAGATDYVLKPNLKRLGPAVVRALREKEIERQRNNVLQALRNSQQLFSKAFDANPYPMAINLLESGQYINVNESFLRATGYSREEAIGCSPAELKLWADPRQGGIIARLLKEHGMIRGLEYKACTKSGEVRDIIFSGDILRINNQVFVLSVSEDITERKNTMEALKRAELRFRDLFESANDIIYMHDLEGNFTALNRKGEQLTGYSREEIAGMNIAQVVAPGYLALVTESIARKIAGDDTGATCEMEIICKDGRSLPLEVSMNLILEGDEPCGVQGIARDISERRLAEAERQRLEAQLLQAQKMESIGRLAGGVAHDFNNLLTAIIGFGQLTQSKLDANHPLQRNLSEMLSASQRAATLTRQLLAFSRRQALVRKTINLNDTIGNLTRMLRRIIGEDIEIALKLTPALEQVYADAGQLEQVIMNLAVNARDAMPRGGLLTIETSNVTFDETFCRENPWARPGKYARMAITDTGVGMDQDTLYRIFEPFFTTKEMGKGTGLGLSVVYGIVQQHDGLINVTSEPGRGTTFEILLPADDRSHEEDSPALQPQIRGGRETILVAEDEEILRELSRTALERLGYRVVMASDGEEALKLFEAMKDVIDILLLDVVMPRMGGRAVCERVRASGSAAPIIFMTGYASEKLDLELIQEKGAALLQKPYSLADLGRMVREVLDSRPTNGNCKG